MTDRIEQAVRASLRILAADPARHDQLRALSTEGQRELPEVQAAVEALLAGGEEGPGVMDTLFDAFLNKLLDSEPFETIGADSGIPGGSDEHSIHALPSGEALICSCDGWSGPFESVDAALDKLSPLIPETRIWHSKDFSEELAAVPESEDRIEIEDEIYYRFDGTWVTDGDGPSYVLHRGTWMTEDEALDAEDQEPT